MDVFLARGLENDKNSVVIVGFMAQHTLGRRLVERRTQVKVRGVERDVRAVSPEVASR